VVPTSTGAPSAVPLNFYSYFCPGADTHRIGDEMDVRISVRKHGGDDLPYRTARVAGGPRLLQCGDLGR
jgi:hypothetical protein